MELKFIIIFYNIICVVSQDILLPSALPVSGTKCFQFCCALQMWQLINSRFCVYAWIMRHYIHQVPKEIVVGCQISGKFDLLGGKLEISIACSSRECQNGKQIFHCFFHCDHWLVKNSCASFNSCSPRTEFVNSLHVYTVSSSGDV